MNNETAGCLSWILTVIIVVVFVYACDYITCKSKSEKQGMECSWGPIQGCMVKAENGWMDYERLRYIKE
jgi:hypothetical protein